MNSMCDLNLKNDFTGDLAENINAITRNQKKLLVEALPKKAQELINFQIRRFDGRNSDEAERWLKDIEEWLAINELCLTGVFDLLLSEEAATLWKNFKCDTTTKEEAREWFTETFMIKKSITDLFMELAEVKQNHDERFATFEIRVRNLLNSVLDSGLSKEEIVSDFLSKRARNSGLKEALITKPNMPIEDIRNLAKLYENREQKLKADEFQVNAVRQRSYADMVQKGHSNGTEYRQKPQRNFGYDRMNQRSIVDSSPIIKRSNNEHHMIDDFKRRNEREVTPIHNSDSRRKDTPMYSMKHIARRIYNKCRGFSAPKDEFLRSGQCFCCGGEDHLRMHCPLKNKCLICGKNDHLFRSCPLLETTSKPSRRSVMCIHEESDDMNQIDSSQDDFEEIKNQTDPIAYISSVGLSQ